MISSIIITTATSKIGSTCTTGTSTSSKGRLIYQQKKQHQFRILVLLLLLPVVVHTIHGFNVNNNYNVFKTRQHHHHQQQKIEKGWQLPQLKVRSTRQQQQQQRLLYVSFNNNNNNNNVNNNDKVNMQRKQSTTTASKITNNYILSVIQSSLFSFILFFIINTTIPFTTTTTTTTTTPTTTTAADTSLTTTTTMKQQQQQQQMMILTKQSSLVSSIVIQQFTSSGIANAAFIPLTTTSSTTIAESTAATTTSMLSDAAPAAATATATAVVNNNNEITNVDKNVALIDEVYTLVDKYYLNKPSIESSSWEQTRDKYRTIMKDKLHGTDNESMAIKIVSDMISTLNDKYSRVLDSKQYTSIQKYDLIGVGISLMPDPSSSTSTTNNNNRNIIVGSPPVPGSAADKQHIHQYDIISAINNIPTYGKSAFDIIEQISANPNAPTITMTVIDSGSTSSKNNVRDVIMDRAYMEIKNPIYYKISEYRTDGTIVGYIQIKEFNSLVKGNFISALQELSKLNVNAYVIDLRHNTGGAFQSAIELSSIFLSNPPTTSTASARNSDTNNNNPIATYVVDNSNIRTPFKTKSASDVLSSLSLSNNDDSNADDNNANANKNSIYIDKSIPIVLLVDKKTASASEVLASALHDNCRAVIVGYDTSTYGKGLIQAVYGLQQYNTGLVLTVAKYITPAGNPIQGIGIQPDILLSSSNSLSILGTTLSMSTDTSMINFNDIQYRLSSNMCTIPTKLD